MVFPTESEGLPRTIIEAMAVGLPCIYSPVDGVVELLDDEYLVEKRTPEAYSKKIEELLNDWEKMIKAGNENYNKALKYENSILNNKRQLFYKKLSDLANTKNNKR